MAPSAARIAAEESTLADVRSGSLRTTYGHIRRSWWRPEGSGGLNITPTSMATTLSGPASRTLAHASVEEEAPPPRLREVVRRDVPMACTDGPSVIDGCFEPTVRL